jgi:hypothetical protein
MGNIGGISWLKKAMRCSLRHSEVGMLESPDQDIQETFSYMCVELKRNLC